MDGDFMYSVYLARGFTSLRRFIEEHINPNGDKIISVTQNGTDYTVVYQLRSR